MAVNQPDAWSEEALVTITPTGGSGVEFAALIETIDIDAGDKDIEAIPNVKGGRIVKKIPEDETTVTFEGYPVDIDVSGGTGISQMFHTTSANYDATEPLLVENSRLRDQFRVAMLATNDTTATSGAGAVASGSGAYRYMAKNGRMISCKPSFTDGIWKFTFAFKFPAFNKQGSANIYEQSTDGTAAMSALSSY